MRVLVNELTGYVGESASLPLIVVYIHGSLAVLMICERKYVVKLFNVISPLKLKYSKHRFVWCFLSKVLGYGTC